MKVRQNLFKGMQGRGIPGTTQVVSLMSRLWFNIAVVDSIAPPARTRMNGIMVSTPENSLTPR